MRSAQGWTDGRNKNYNNDNSSSDLGSFLDHIMTSAIPVSYHVSSPQGFQPPRPDVHDYFTAMAPTHINQCGTDPAWKTILASVVDVEGIGNASAARV
jgi:hypothetical protein